jgi:hypothetical protein
MNENASANDISTNNVCDVSSLYSFTSCALRDGSEFHLNGEFKDPQHVIKCSNDFESVVMIVKNLKCDADDDDDDEDENVARRNDGKLNDALRGLSQEIEECAKISIAQEHCDMLREIGAPWNWLHNFTSHNCRYKSYNFLENSALKSAETIAVTADDVEDYDESSDESFDYFSRDMLTTARHAAQSATSTIFDDVQSSISGISNHDTDGRDEVDGDGVRCFSGSNEHKGEKMDFL